MAHNSKRQRALQAVGQIERPEGISAPTWRGVVALLKAIAEFYPNPYPSQKVLAARTGYSVASIERYVSVAKAHGLLLVKADAGKCSARNNWKKTNRYHIVMPSECGPPLPSECGVNPTGTSYPPGSLRSPLSPREGELEAPDPACGRMSRLSEEPSRQIRSDPSPAPVKRPAKRPGGVKAEQVLSSGHGQRQLPKVMAPPTGTRHLINYFIVKWMDMTQDPAINPALRELYWEGDRQLVRIVENVGKATQYLNVHFLGPNALQPQTEGQVQTLIDGFMDAVKRGDITIRPTQTVWQCFTGMWGKTELRLDEDEAARRYFGDHA